MIDEIRLKNFKCFREVSVPLGPLTLLAGMNGMGKSTVIQSLLLYRQWVEDGSTHTFQGYWINLGSFSDIYSYFAADDTVKIELVRKGQPSNIMLRSKSSEHAFSFVVGGNYDDRLYVVEHLSFLSADRWGPRVTLPIAENRGSPCHVGKNGEFVAHYMYVHGDGDLPNPTMPAHTGARSRKLHEQVSAWLSEVSPGASPDFDFIPRADVSYSSFRFKAGTDMTPKFRPTNVGFGLSYSLPVIVALLAAKQGDIVLIENPEAHLHPAGQTAIGRLIALTAQAGVQVIVETHSDHVLDGIRIAVKRKIITPERVRIHYFQRNQDGEGMITSPVIDSGGMIDEWPEGFFDQAILNLAELGAPNEGGGL